MAITLGYDGKQRAININKGDSVTAIPTLYVGLLQTEATDMDAMTLSTLIHSSNGNEFSISPNFYTGRKVITMSIATTDATGSYSANNNVAPIEWTNNTGVAIEVEAFFITDVASGGAGQVLWVGVPDAGTATINDSAKAILNAGDLIIRID